MLFPKNAKIESACSKLKSARYATNDPWLDMDDPDKPCVVATDGCILISQPVEYCEMDHAGPVPADALKAARKSARKRQDHFTLCLNGSARVLETGDEYLRDSSQRFPHWRSVVPSPDRSAQEKSITISITQLARLAEAAGAYKGALGTVATLHYIEGSLEEPVRVEFQGTSATCLVMPIKPR